MFYNGGPQLCLPLTPCVRHVHQPEKHCALDQHSSRHRCDSLQKGRCFRASGKTKRQRPSRRRAKRVSGASGEGLMYPLVQGAPPTRLLLLTPSTTITPTSPNLLVETPWVHTHTHKPNNWSLKVHSHVREEREAKARNLWVGCWLKQWGWRSWRTSNWASIPGFICVLFSLSASIWPLRQTFSITLVIHQEVTSSAGFWRCLSVDSGYSEVYWPDIKLRKHFSIYKLTATLNTIELLFQSSLQSTKINNILLTQTFIPGKCIHYNVQKVQCLFQVSSITFPSQVLPGLWKFH